MTNDQDNEMFPAGHWLNGLVKRADKIQTDRFTRPSVATIQAYLSYDATEAQRSEVIAALSISSQFRKEIKEMADDLEAISAISGEETSDDDSDIEVPDLSAHISDETEIADIRDTLLNAAPLEAVNIGLGAPTIQSDTQGILKKRSKTSWLKNYRIVLPAMAAAALLIVVSIPMLTDDSDVTLVSEALDPGSLIPLNLRGAGDSDLESRSFETAELAAISCFQEMLLFEDFALTINPVFVRPLVVDSECITCLVIHHPNGDISAEIPPQHSFEADRQPTNFQVWLLSFQSNKLWSMNIDKRDNRNVLPWKPEFGPTLLVAFTYESKGRYFCEPSIVVRR